MENLEFRRKKSGKFALGNRGGPGRPPKADEEGRVKITDRPPPAERPDHGIIPWKNAHADWILNGYWYSFE